MVKDERMGQMPGLNAYGHGHIVGATRRGRTRGRSRGWLAGLVLVAACSGTKSVGEEPEASGLAAAAPSDPEAPAGEDYPTEEELGPIAKNSFREHPAGVAWVFEEGEAPKEIPIGAAEARGYSIIDLSNSWTPYIFSEKTPGTDDEQGNLYRETYLGLANDRVDHWGDELDDHEHNYLELYGIPPSLAVIQDEWAFVDAEVKPCLEQAGFDPAVFGRYDGVIAYKRQGRSKRNKSARWRRGSLFKKMRKMGLDPESPEDLATAAEDPKTRGLYKNWRKDQDVIDIIDHAQRRFRCERLFNSADGRGKFEAGIYDSDTTHALANFERKHDLMGWGHFKKDNREALGLSPDESVHRRLIRAIEERVVMSTGIIEDGSAARWKDDFRWTDADGKEHPLPNLVESYSSAVVEALGMTTPEAAKEQLAVLSDLGKGGFEDLLVAVKLPSRPAYYSDDMALSTVIDRGDIWYDFPYDDEGNKVGQPRKRYPHLTVYVEYEGQTIPLVHWRTTIGSWRTELSEGEVMLKYKNSDVGPRVWKDIMAAPVWIPPPSTPTGELIKTRWRKGKLRTDVNYAETGPGYTSAYGLVAAYHVKQIKREDGTVKAEIDNGIRTHGSVDYMSILRRFSHGCHRLYNMDAVRMFSFVLRHREYVRHGQQHVGVRRPMEHEGKSFTMKLDTRGYKYELVEPIPVRVTEGRIRGSQRTPIEEYVPKPVKPEELEAEATEDGAPTETTIDAAQ